MTVGPDVLERIYAGVLGKLIGVYSGRPFEGWTYARIMAELGPIDRYVHDRFDVPLVVTDDDVAGTFTFVRALADNNYDPALDAGRIGDTWMNYLVENRAILWWGGLGNSTEETAWRRLKAGIRAPGSGSIELNGRTVAEQIGAQIFIDGWAMVSPGRPDQAAHLARAAATVSHDGEAVHAAVVLAVMEAAAFEERDLDRLLDRALATIPADCLVTRIVGDVREWYAASGDWEETRARIEKVYGYHLYPGHCHVVPNFAVVLMALLHGGDDFDRVVMIANTAGWDTDCNAGNAACLTGIRLGLSAIDGGGVGRWRGPVADRLYLPSADGGSAIGDAVQISYALLKTAQTLSGTVVQPPPKGGARFHFSLPGSVQGFEPLSDRTTVENKVQPTGERGLVVSLFGSDLVSTPTFAPPDVDRMRTYEMTACPSLYPGQTAMARVIASPQNAGALDLALAVVAYGADDAEEKLTAPAVTLQPGEATTLQWTIPSMSGRPIARVGVQAEAATHDIAGYCLDWLGWNGEPSTILRRPDRPGRFWRKAWVNAVSLVNESFPEAYRVSQNEGLGLLLQGTREWRDYRVDATVTVCLGSGGIAARMQGLRRGYLLMLIPGGQIALLKLRDSETQIMQQADFVWSLDRQVPLALVVVGATIKVECDGHHIFEVDDGDRPYLDGAIGLCVEAGAVSSDSVSIAPATKALQIPTAD